MPNENSLAKAAALAAVIAGPLFLTLLALFDYEESAPCTFPLDWSEVLSGAPVLFFLLVVSVIIGAALALPTCLVAGGILRFLGDRVPITRPLIIWIGIGTGIALAVLEIGFGEVNSIASYAFIGTAMACAAIVRTRLVWE